MTPNSWIADRPRPATTPARPYAAPRRSAYLAPLNRSFRSWSARSGTSSLMTRMRGGKQSHTAAWTTSDGVLSASTRRPMTLATRGSAGSRWRARRPKRMTSASVMWSCVSSPVLGRARYASNVAMRSWSVSLPCRSMRACAASSISLRTDWLRSPSALPSMRRSKKVLTSMGEKRAPRRRSVVAIALRAFHGSSRESDSSMSIPNRSYSGRSSCALSSYSATSCMSASAMCSGWMLTPSAMAAAVASRTDADEWLRSGRRRGRKSAGTPRPFSCHTVTASSRLRSSTSCARTHKLAGNSASVRSRGCSRGRRGRVSDRLSTSCVRRERERDAPGGPAAPRAGRTPPR